MENDGARFGMLSDGGGRRMVDDDANDGDSWQNEYERDDTDEPPTTTTTKLLTATAAATATATATATTMMMRDVCCTAYDHCSF